MTFASQDGQLILEKLHVDLSLLNHFLFENFDSEMASRSLVNTSQNFAKSSFSKFSTELISFIYILNEFELLIIIHAQRPSHLHSRLTLLLLLLYRFRIVLYLFRGQPLSIHGSHMASMGLWSLKRILPLFCRSCSDYILVGFFLNLWSGLSNRITIISNLR